MQRNSYALLVKIDEVEDIYEVFDVVNMIDFNVETFNRWKSGFESNNVKIVEIENGSYISMGSEWDGKSFIIENDNNKILLEDQRGFFGLVSNNKLFGMIAFDKESFQYRKYHAAVSLNVIGLDVTGKNITFGDIWNGTSFIKSGY